MVVVEGGKCPTPCKREGKLSGKEKFPGGGHYVRRTVSWGKCPELVAVDNVASVSL